ncbi:MAG TPA: hypothetical protein VJ765_17375 [Chitinophagaceae bacterium]|nr:hypothetical protein [Chitinophagaceae bacterium]
MKRVIFISIMSAACLLYKPVAAQVSVNINIGAQPVWGPVGYDYVEYYYIPDIEVYYYVPSRKYIYLSNGRWIFATTLPYRHRGYNIYSGYKVVINEPRPYLRFTTHKVVYAKYKGNNGRQGIIKNSNNPKYYVVKGHPKYSTKGNKGAGNPKAKGNHGSGNAGSKGKGSGKNKS